MRVSMRHWLTKTLLLLGLSAVLGACSSGQPSAATNLPLITPAVALLPTLISVTTVATSAISTTGLPSVAAAQTLPIGTLILTQLGKPVARIPNGQTVVLTTDRFIGRGSPDARYGVRLNQVSGGINVVLVDYGATPSTVKDVPQGAGLFSPAVAWKDDSSGFAFYDFPPQNKVATSRRTIYYYDVASGQTKILLDNSKAADAFPSAKAFSPDGKQLIYAINPANADSPGGPGSETYLLDIASGQSKQLPAESSALNRWLNDSSGFIVTKQDASGSSQILLYTLADPTNPKSLTPKDTRDLLIDLSLDGKHFVVTSAPVTKQQTANQPTNIYIMNLDGSNRKALTKFTDVDQAITSLVWGADGIYYSVTGASGTSNNADVTWRIDLDGTNAKSLANGTLYAVVGTR